MRLGNGLGVVINKSLQQIDIWDGTVAASFSSGTGTQTNPYLITKGSEMAYLAQQVNAGNQYSGVYFEQIININLNNIAWTPIGADPTTIVFKGNYNGNGYYFKNLYISGTRAYTGLFGAIRTATLTAAVVSGYVKGSTNTGGVCGYVYDADMIECYNGASIVASASNTQFVGGVTGRITNSSTCYNCYNFGSVTSAGTYIGGITGQLAATSTLKYCYNRGVVSTGASSYGSIIGSNSSSTIGYCYNDSQICSLGAINNADVANQGEGKTTAQMKTKSTYLTWDFAYYWYMIDGADYPSLVIYL